MRTILIKFLFHFFALFPLRFTQGIGSILGYLAYSIPNSLHEPTKVNLELCFPEMSDQAHMELLENAEKLVQGLGLHYQVTKLAAQDISGAMAKTYDVEIWIPSLERYTEVSSVSNSRDYQARRGKIRFRRSDTRRTEFVHTLNASGLATSRLFVGLVEQNQQPDGSLIIPEVLRKWVGKDVVYPK